MLSPEQRADLKSRALHEAVEAFSGTGLMGPKSGEMAEETHGRGVSTILKAADRFYGWLTGPIRVILLKGPEVEESSTVDTPKTPVPEGAIVQINTGQKFSVAIDTRDAAGYPTDATVEWVIADTNVATVVHDDADDQKGWVVSGAPGSTVLTVRVTDVEPPLEATLAVDVVPAGTATVQINAGPAVPEEDPQPGPLTVTATEDTTDVTRMSVSLVVDNKGEGQVTVALGHDGVSLVNPGDGTTVTTHQYPAPGNYEVVVTDDDNASRMTSVTVTVPYTV